MYKLTDKIQSIRYCTLFLVILSVFTIALFAYLFYAHNVSVKSQQQIKESYKTHLQKADSLYFHLAAYNKSMTLANQNINSAVLADSIIKESLQNTNHLSRTQVKSIKLIIDTHFHNIELLHKKYGEKLSMDSLRLCTERDLLEGQTKAMIDLHLDKIEHEYSNITMWGAILTILFLVFSFYSLYKIDELIKQGQEGVVKINNLKTDGERIVSQFEEKKQKVFNDINSQILEMTDAISKEQQQKFDNLEKQLQEQIRSTAEYITSIKIELKNNSKSMLDNYSVRLTSITEQHKEFYEKFSETQQKEFNQLIIQAQQILEELEDKKNKMN